ncbi:hypothetical protein Hanom_Chr13g01240711 [Helianthus anomalus]
MALRLKEQNKVTIGAPLVKPNDDLFWFGKPQFVLTLLHYTLFVNAFEFAFFVWVSVRSLTTRKMTLTDENSLVDAFKPRG